MLLFGEAKNLVHNAHDSIEHGVPHALCPTCGGACKTAGKKCEGCRGSGMAPTTGIRPRAVRRRALGSLTRAASKGSESGTTRTPQLPRSCGLAGRPGVQLLRSRAAVGACADTASPSPIPLAVPRRPAGCPQPCGRVDTAEVLMRRGSHRCADGDRHRQIDELSPGMCTGWGDLVCARSQEVTVPTLRTGRGTVRRRGAGRTTGS